MHLGKLLQQGSQCARVQVVQAPGHNLQDS